MNTRTKIICTIGPAVNTIEKMMELIDSGMNVARINLSHGTYADREKMIADLKSARAKSGKPLAILLDTKGAEVRLRDIEGGSVILEKGDVWLLVKEELIGDRTKVSINPPYVLDHIHIGDMVLFDDGYIQSKVIGKSEVSIAVEIINGGVIKSKKGVNVPNVDLKLPALTEQDIQDIRFACTQDIDIIAASFIRTAENVLLIKNLLKENHANNVLVISKIENAEGVQNFDSILLVSDGIMIARGDLGVEVPMSQIPKLQKMMIRKCYLAGKPAVTATQMLESMIYNPRPTRAEVSDVANAIYDSSSAVMLSGETAAGKYPVEAVKMMKSIIIEAENDFDYQQFFQHHSSLIYNDVTSSVTLASVKTAYNSNAKAIFCFTCRGSSAALLSRLRPRMNIIAMTPSEKCFHQMSIHWGVIPFLAPNCANVRDAVEEISRFSLQEKIVSNGDLVVVIAGSPFGISGTTNMMMVENIGDVLARGQYGWGEKIHATVAVLLSPESRKPYELRNRIVIIRRCDDTYYAHLRESSGIILQNHIDDHDSEGKAISIAKELNIPLLIRVDGAGDAVKEGQLVTLDPAGGVVYKGAKSLN